MVLKIRIECISHQTTITGLSSYATIIKNPRKYIVEKRRGKLDQEIFALQDNATPRKSKVERDVIQKVEFEYRRHPP